MTEPVLLLSSNFRYGSMFLKFYDPTNNSIIIRNTGNYSPYILVESDNGEEKHDLLTGKTRKFKREFNLYENGYEKLKPADSFLYDNKLCPGMWYVLNNDSIKPHNHETPREMTIIIDKMISGLTTLIPNMEYYKKSIQRWGGVLNEPIPTLKRVAFDIETTSQNPNDGQITAIAFSGSGIELSLVVGNKTEKKMDGKLLIKTFPSEAEMIKEGLLILMKYPIILSWFGDGFDVPFLYNRARKLNLDTSMFRDLGDSVMIEGPLHIDLYSVFSNHSLQNYAFGGRYNSYKLNDVSVAMIGKEKIGIGSDAKNMTLNELAKYCHHDALLTFQLSDYDDAIVMKLLVIFARITSLGMDRLSRSGISRWILSMHYRFMRENNILIPTPSECHSRSGGQYCVSGDKKYKGGYVMEPVPGIHWDATVLDFASMYPGIIERNNISWETVRCPHEECKDTIIPGTEHWRCTKRNGMLTEMIGSLRQLRVHYFKPLSKNDKILSENRSQYETISQAIKVLMNASYGVMGSDKFPLYYLPVADSITASGRHIISNLVERCGELGITVLYGDTDSVFVKNADEKQIEEIIRDTNTKGGVELEVDKKYKYIILTERKKNYLGIRHDGSRDVKGLTGKKSHTPPFITKSFEKLVGMLSGIEHDGDQNKLNEEISMQLRTDLEELEGGNISLNDLAFKMKITKEMNEYSKSSPQHISAAKLLETQSGQKLKKDDMVYFIKTRHGAVPLELAAISDIDHKKYTEFLTSTYDQIIPALQMSAEDIIAGSKQESMASFFPNR